MLQNDEGKYLVVWNKRYGGFSFPGGRVEYGETPEEAAFRELLEETCVEAIGVMTQVFEGEHGVKVETTRGSMVHVFECKWFKHKPSEREPGCPITWWTREEFLKWSPFREFYARVFERLDTGSQP